MNKDAVQHERGPRNSTLRRQMAMFINGKDMISSDDVKKMQQDLVFRALPMQPAIPSYILDLSSRTRAMVDPSAYRTPVLSPFHPIPLSPTNAFPSIFEKAAELIIKNMQWIKALSKISPLSIGDQQVLLEHSWTDLFILGAAQSLPAFNFSALLFACQASEKSAMIHTETNDFQSILCKLADMNIDGHEYNCLRSIALYNAVAKITMKDETKGDVSKCRLEDTSKIITYRDEAIADLATYINITNPLQPLRLKNLLLMLEQLKRVSSYTLEELFFRRTIGEVTIVKLMLDMYENI